MNTQRFFGLHLMISGLSIACCGYLKYGALDPSQRLYGACALFALVAVWLFYSWQRTTCRLLDPYTLFALAIILFNGGHLLLELVGANQNGVLNGEFSENTVIDSACLVIVSIAAFHCGALGSLLHRRGRVPRAATMSRRITRTTERLGWVMLLAALLASARLFLADISDVMAHGYFYLYSRPLKVGLDTAPYVASCFIVPAAFLILSCANLNRLKPVTVIAVILLYATAQMFLGGRSAASIPIVCAMWLWSRVVGRISRGFAIAVVLGLLVLLPIVGATRNIRGADRVSLDVAIDAARSLGNPIVSMVTEMGGSMRTVAHTLELVPEVRGYDYGASYLYASFAIFPNLFWDVHPSGVHGSLSRWLVVTVAPNTASSNGGLGYSLIAEAYANFGWYGTPLLMALIGYIWARTVRHVERCRDPRTYALVATMLTWVLVFARGESIDVLRGMVWFGLFPFCLTWLIDVVIRRGAAAKAASRVSLGTTGRQRDRFA